jgi:hypothetical protein
MGIYICLHLNREERNRLLPKLFPAKLTQDPKASS